MIDRRNKELADLRTRVGDIRRGAPIAGDARFNRYYLEYWFPQFTRVDELDRTAKSRSQFQRTELWPMGKGNPEAHAALNDLTLKTMTSVVADPGYHPFARYTAMLLIGDLNQQEPAVGTAAVPYPPALNTILRAIPSDRIPDGARVAAMNGLERHLAAGISDADKAKVRQIMRDIATAENPPNVQPPRSPEAHAWIRRKAADILTSLGEKAPEIQMPGPEASPVASAVPAPGGAGAGAAAPATTDPAATNTPAPGTEPDPLSNPTP